MKLNLILLFTFLSSITSNLSSLAAVVPYSTTSPCHSRCVQICRANVNIIDEDCASLCTGHCAYYATAAADDHEDGSRLLPKSQTDCLLLCAYTQANKYACHSICKPFKDEDDDSQLGSSSMTAETATESETPTETTTETEPIDKPENFKVIGQGCVGYGREYCYKACRLEHKKSIPICLCACCWCKF